MITYTVYQHITPSNKVYIGITRQPVKRRWKNGNGYKTNIHFFNAIKKYGWENIQHNILYENLKEEEAKEKEIELIKQYNSTNKDFGYNISAGGDIGLPVHLRKKHSHKYTKKEKIQKMFESTTKESVLQFDKYGNFVKEYPSIREAAFQLTGNRSNGKHISRVCKNEMNNYKGFLWIYKKDFSEKDIEKRVKNFIDIKRENISNKKVSVLQKDLNGNVIKMYDSYTQAGKAINKSRQAISMACQTNKVLCGYLWEKA